MGNQMIDLITTIAVRTFIGILSIIPDKARVWFLDQLLFWFTFLLPSYRKVSRINLKIAFPDLSEPKREKILRESFTSLAIAISDFVRFPRITPEWIKSHVEFPYLEKYKKLKASETTTGLLVATGHLGSFELQAYMMSVLGYPLSFVVRNFKLPLLDRWWNGRREKYGNRVLNRAGAFRRIVKELKQGRDVGVLFDQNVKRSHAVFVPWFSKEASTTKSLALAALETKAKVVVVGLITIGFDKYRMEVIECDFSSIYESKALKRSEKVLEITKEISSRYQTLIEQHPEGWFWMHRRWKTQKNDDFAY